jgi:hypothetical protein
MAPHLATLELQGWTALAFLCAVPKVRYLSRLRPTPSREEFSAVASRS